jgi:hypothetical protein
MRAPSCCFDTLATVPAAARKVVRVRCATKVFQLPAGTTYGGELAVKFEAKAVGVRLTGMTPQGGPCPRAP